MKQEFNEAEVTLGRISSGNEEIDGCFDLDIKIRELRTTVRIRLKPDQLANLVSTRVARGFGEMDMRPLARVDHGGEK